ncbi:hypothetical protein ACVDG3_21225 [Meridianimarinicoccus sp. RP-17]|uniref:hypothetical protein n=1 Tax=Meridianimarinicoccus zhengii TaxID=2056810 RepID=UPI000DAB9A14|nr:hypothetical protein [Phycocomes zhengii]
MSGGWHVLDDGMALTLARRLPPRFDLSEERQFPPVRRRALAHAIRQDVWRALRSLRGFTPVVRVARHGDGLSVRAGGACDGALPAVAQARLAQVMDCPARRARWIRHAGPRSC